MYADKGLIFNIQRYSLHDGKGIRTIVFFKGCPLACRWCSNPESQSYKPQMVFSQNNCIACGECSEVCKNGAFKDGAWDIQKCMHCGACAENCPTAARELAGKWMSVEQIVNEVVKDWAFYQSSNGGVTFSGGEPLVQAKFAEQLAKKLKSLYVDLTIETCGYASWDNAKRVLRYMDSILYDIKLMDTEKHLAYTGVGNTLILGNARKAAALGKKMIIRIPVIGGVNDDDENIRQTALFALEIGVDEIHLLPYHRYGESKYHKLGLEYAFEAYTPSDEQMARLVDIVKAHGIHAKTGG